MTSQNIAQKILELQALLQQNQSLQNIKALNELYVRGIEFYIQNQIPKARLLQKKMAQLLKRTSVLQVLQQNTISGPNDKKNEAGEKLNRKLKNQIGKFHVQAQNQIKYLMQQSKQCAKRVNILKKKDIRKQQSQLIDRIQTRGKSKGKDKKFMSMKQIKFTMDNENL